MTLESMAAEIRQCSAKLTELKESSAEAVHLRDKTLVELKEQEQLLFAHQKRQELELFNMKRTLNFLKEQPIPTKTLPVRLLKVPSFANIVIENMNHSPGV